MDDADRRAAGWERRCMECGRRITRGYLCEFCDGVTFEADPADGD